MQPLAFICLTFFFALFPHILFSSPSHNASLAFIRIIEEDGKYKFEIPDKLLGEDILFGSRIVDLSSPSAKIYAAGQMRRPPVLIRFDRRGNLMVMEQPGQAIDLDEEDPLAGAVERNRRVVGAQYFDIESRNAADDASVIDVTAYFSDRVALAWPLPDSERKGRLETKLSGLLFMRAFEDRVNVRSHYVFIGDKETFTITVQYFLLRLPREPLLTRYNDERIGYQGFNKKVFASGKSISTNRYITRWRVAPAAADIERHAAGELVPPQNPIVIYIEPYFPSSWIPYIKEGVEAWNAAFERIGFKDVVVAREFPLDDPNFDPYDIKTNVIRYIPIEEANAAGETWTDPRSGEIINGEILWWNNVVDLLNMWRFTQTAAVDPRARAIHYPEEMMGEIIRYAMAHEMGHVLGLQHNLRSSYAYPVDSLRSPTFTQQYGTAASVMDYARFNHVAQPGDLERGVNLMPPVLGPFDLFSIAYGYTYVHGATIPDDELPALRAIFDARQENPVYAFAPFTVAPVAPDPAVQSGSLGDDVIRSAILGISNTRIILDSLMVWTVTEGGSLADVRERYDALLRQYFRFISMGVSYIGGVYGFYEPVDQNQIRQIPVQKEKQQEALSFVITGLREAPAYLDQECIAAVIGPQKDNILKRQSEIIQSLLGQFVLPRVLRNPCFGHHVYELDEYLADLDRLIWQSFGSGSLYDRNIQISYVQALAETARLPEKGGSFSSASHAIITEAAFARLIETKRKLEHQLPGRVSPLPHRMFLLKIIEQQGHTVRQ